VIAHYSNDAGRDAVKGHAADGNAEDHGTIHVETLQMTDCEFQQAVANPEDGVTYEQAAAVNVMVHEMHEVFTSSGDEQTPYGIDMVKTNDVPQGDFNVKVCVVDTGYQLGHEDMPVESNGVDGYSPYGAGEKWNQDGHGHGTHCAGTIGAIGGNNIGVDSCNPDPTKFTFFIGKGLTNSGSGSSSGVIAAVNKCVEAGAKIISMSLGGGSASQASRAAYEDAYNQGVLIIAAAGNSGNTVKSYPASYPHVMSVAAIDSSKNKAGFSQWNDQVEIAAPGVGVKSPISGNGNSFNQYASWSGTSMACPHVAGVAARVWSNFPTCTNHQIRGALLKTAEDLGEGGCDTKYGEGLVNAKAAYDLLLAGGCEAGGMATGESPGGCQQKENHGPTPAPTPEPPCPQDCAVVVEVTTDNYHEENKWTVKDADGAEVGGDDALAGPRETTRDRVCLNRASTYTFTITDQYGDGMCCGYGSGGYKILKEGGEVLKESDGKFEREDTYVIDTSAVCGTGSEQPVPTPGPIGEQPAPTPGPIGEQPAPTPPAGDEMCQGTCDSRAFEVAMEVHSDAAEAVWELKDSSGASVATGKGLTQDGTVREHKSCIGGGSYTFTIFGHGDVNWKVSLDGSEQGSGTVPTIQTVSIAACGGSSPPETPAPTPPPAGACGVKGSGHGNLIVNGEDADRCEWKWQASLVRGNFAFCGGTLIADQWVLSAAHCTQSSSPGDFDVILGDYNWENHQGANEQRRSVEAIFNHPNYNTGTQTNFDFSLIKLSSPVELNDCVGTACLPTEDIADGSTCYITGWGTLSSGGGRTGILQEAAVNIVPNDQCNQAYSGGITSNMLCANGRNSNGAVTDACQGDSGGPLVCESNGRWVVHGATSWGRGCASADYPGVWARVYHELDWINQKMAA